MKELTAYEGALCANCQTALEGEYCHHCGQSVHSVLRPMHGLFEEFLETFLHIDGRILHTLPPLLLKPGFLTLEYFSGRRVRYIAPFRLMFVLCLLTFFVLHVATDVIAHRIEQRHQQTLLVDKGDSFADAKTADDVSKELKRKLETLEATRTVGGEAIAAQVKQAEQRLREQANARLAQLGAPVSTSTSGEPQAAPGRDVEKTLEPVQIGWLPGFVNESLTTGLSNVRKNGHALNHGSMAERRAAWEHVAAGIYSVLPGTMLVLVPVFALLLKLFYIFKRRLYMEHVIVSLHSHAFLFLNLLLIALLGMLSTGLKPYAAGVGYAVGILQAPLILWIPAYLLIMQKRVYRQGWVVTVLKFGAIGWCYLWLLMVMLTVAAVLGLTH